MKKKRGEITSNFPAVSRLDLSYVSEHKGKTTITKHPFWGDDDDGGSEFNISSPE